MIGLGWKISLQKNLEAVIINLKSLNPSYEALTMDPGRADIVG